MERVLSGATLDGKGESEEGLEKMVKSFKKQNYKGAYAIGEFQNLLLKC